MSQIKDPRKPYLGNGPVILFAAIFLALAMCLLPHNPEVDSQSIQYSHLASQSARVEFALHDVRDYERWIKADEQKYIDAQGRVIPVASWSAEDRKKHEELRSLLLNAKSRYNSFAYEYNQLMEREGFKFTTQDSLPNRKNKVLARRFEPLPTHQ